GKNIVGVVLQCNNFEVIDMGVMVSCDAIIKKAKEENADMIGLSGLITPSLDEMVYVASEMQRLGLNLPLLIGGATTSKAHTAVKIEPQYKNNITVYVSDASRAVTVASQLVNDESREIYWQDTKNEYAKIRQRMSTKKERPMLSYAQALENKVELDWESFTPTVPQFIGTRTFIDVDLREVLDVIDWTPFFIAWELSGKFPKILEDEVVGEAARELFANAQDMLKDLIDNKRISANAVIGFWPANRIGDDDIEVYDEK